MLLLSGLSLMFGIPFSMDQIIVEMASTATIAITLFGIVFCLMQTKHSRVSHSFALFLGSVTLNNIPDAFSRVFEMVPHVYIQTADLIIWMPSNLCLAPLFWMYVVTLTSTAQRRPARFYRHLVLPTTAVLVGLMASVSPDDIRHSIFSYEDVPSSAWSLTLVATIGLLQLTVYPQMAIYVFLIVQRMLRYRRMLRDVYASTEKHELRWIYVIGGLAALFWLVQTTILLVAIEYEQAGPSPVFLYIASFAGLTLVAATTLWGLRQSPPLVPKATGEQPPETAKAPPLEQGGQKYEKSALSSDASARIARKLRTAMERDHLHRDPNLSLWVLARHIGASPNYISQTLSEVIGESFFDFVNGYRISEAMTLLSTTNQTVLTITYDVGFNARSSFYNAFKRCTGQTPTNYRKTLSHPDGADEVNA